MIAHRGYGLVSNNTASGSRAARWSKEKDGEFEGKEEDYLFGGDGGEE